MFSKLEIIFYIFLCLIYSSEGLDFARFYTIRGTLQPLPPMPTVGARNCLNSLAEELIQCRNSSAKVWNISDYSALGDVCCAQWDIISCGQEHVSKSKCKDKELEEVDDYFEDLIDFYNEKTCRPFQRGDTHCVVPIISVMTHERPPPPSPLAIDCLANIRPEVRLQCLKTAYHKWNITKKSHPIKNLCCAAWDDIDCLDQVVKIRCPAEEVTATDAYFKQLEAWAADKPCKQASYHSANCTKQQKLRKVDYDVPLPTSHFDGLELEQPEFDDRVIFPAKPVKKNLNPSEFNPNSEIDSDYREFVMNYILTVFPHLMNLLILLSVILVTVIVIQCLMIGRQLKKNAIFSDYGPIAQGYRKVDV